MSADEIRRLLFRISEINSQCQRVMYDVSGDFDYWAILHNVGESSTSTNRLAVGATLKEKEKNSRRRDRSAKRLQQSLIWVQELADEKKQIVTQLQELIEIKTRQVALETASASIGTGSGSGNGGGGGGASSSGSGNNYSAETKKRKADPISEDGLTYCVCNQRAFGEMILCHNDLCPIEWFHLSCVALVLKIKGKWYCPNCRGDRQNLMKPKAQFLKDLERGGELYEN